MKKAFEYILPAALALIAAVSCEDHRSDYLEDFQTMIYFRNGGEQEITVYRTGEPGIYAIPVCKSGRNLSGEASCEILRLDDTQISMYNLRKETSYTAIPADMVKLVDVKKDEGGIIKGSTPLSNQDKLDLVFSADDAYKVFYVSVDTDALSALQAANPYNTYVLGFQICSQDKISDDINIIVVVPTVDIPKVYFTNSGMDVKDYTSESGEEDKVFHNKIALNMDANRWDFTCGVSILGQAWLDAYNSSHNTEFKLFPAADVTLSSSSIAFKAGEVQKDLDITINVDNIEFLEDYVIPVNLSSCSKTEFMIDTDKDTYLISVRKNPDRIALTEDMIKLSDNFNAANDGDGVPGILDGDDATFWHSPWATSPKGNDPVYGIYFDIELDEPLTTIVLKYLTRSNPNGAPTHIVVGVGNDGENWTILGDVTSGLATGALEWVTLPPMTDEAGFGYIRFGIAESVAGDLREKDTEAYTQLSEFELYGQ